MSSISPKFILTWLITALAAMVTWFVLPGTGVDRWAFHSLAGQASDESVAMYGKGSHANPWQMQVLDRSAEAPPQPVIIGLKDNLDEIFQASPHAPIDMAVIFNNLRRLGAQRLTCSVLLAWEDPDPIGLTAMESAMGEFQSVVLAAPVTRGAIMDTMPPSMRRASVAVEEIAGDPSALPVVNRISIPNLIHGGANTLTGFEVIDSDPAEASMPLMARWDDRVIFSYSVLAAAQVYGVSVKDLEIEMGSHLQIGKNGPRVKIDEFGRLAMPALGQPMEPDLLAEDLIDAKTGDANLPPLMHTMLCDFRSHGDITTRDFNRMAPVATTKLVSGDSTTKLKKFVRLSSVWEMLLLLAWATGLAFSTLLGRRAHCIICLLGLIVSVAALWLGFQQALWLPGTAALITALVAWLCALIWGQSRKRTTSMPRLDRLGLDSVESTSPPDKPAEEEDYALAPKE